MYGTILKFMSWEIPAFCICEKKRHRSTVLSHRLICALAFLCLDCRISSFYIRNLKLLASLCHCTGLFVSLCVLMTHLISLLQTPGREADHGGVDVHRPETGGSKRCC